MAGLTVTCKHCNITGFKRVRGESGKFHLEDGFGNPHVCGAKKQFIANKNATCPGCGGEIKAGETPVTWARRGANKGVLFHETCPTIEVVSGGKAVAAAVSAVTTPPPAVAAPSPSLDDELTAKIQATILAALGMAAPAPIATPATKTIAAPTKAATKIASTSKWWEILDAVIAAGMTRILLVGPPGTGKSTTADRDGLRVTCHEDAGPESMVGTFIQKDGNTVWINGPCVKSMLSGKRIVLDEIDHSSPECVSLLYALLDDAPSIVLPTGDTVKAAHGYQVVGTSNSNPADFPDAILDRFECVIIAGEPHPAAMDGVKEDAGTKATALVGVMTNYYRSLGDGAYSFRGNPTLRKCRNFAKLLAAGIPDSVAANVVFGKAGKEIQSAMTTSGVIF